MFLGVPYLCGLVTAGPAAPDCGLTPGAYTKTNFIQVLDFLRSGGVLYGNKDMNVTISKFDDIFEIA